MDELCDNALDADWIESKQREEEERIQKGREHVMTGTCLSLFLPVCIRLNVTDGSVWQA